MGEERERAVADAVGQPAGLELRGRERDPHARGVGVLARPGLAVAVVAQDVLDRGGQIGAVDHRSAPVTARVSGFIVAEDAGSPRAHPVLHRHVTPAA